jgi:hypothetical protein
VAVLRAVLVTVSPLLGELLLATLLPHLSLDVIAILETREGLGASLGAWSPDLVLLGLLGGETDAAAQAVLALVPTAKILAVTANGAPAWLLEPHGPPLALSDLSAHEMVLEVAARFNIPPPKG